MKTSSYWKKRVELLEDANHNNATKYADEISRVYDSATRELEGQLTKWYTRYATNEGITLAEAKRLLNSRELEEFRMDVHEYIKKGRSLDPQWAKQLEGASVRVHISRLEALKVQTQQLAERTKGYVADSFDEFAVKTYSDQYYKTIFEVQKGAGIGFDITKLDEKQVRKVINKPWAVDGKNFSQRIWGDRTKLVNELHQTLSKGIIQGKAPQKMVKEVSERMGVSKSATARLVYTESSFFANQATLDSYKELGVDRYEVLATLDKRTTPICQKMDGKTFGVNEMEVGVNYPPFHVYCRTTTVPYFDDEFDIQEERASRGNDGKYYTVPASMKYPEWFDTFVMGGSKKGLVEVAKATFESKMAEFKDELNQSFKELEAKQNEIKTLNSEHSTLKREIRILNNEKNNVVSPNLKSAFEKYKQLYGVDIDEVLDKSKLKLKEVSEKYEELLKKHDLYYNRGDMDRAEWREWRNSIDFDGLFKELTRTQREKGLLEKEILDLENIKTFKSKFVEFEEKLLQIDEDIASKTKQIELNEIKVMKIQSSIKPLETQIEEKTREVGKVFIDEYNTTKSNLDVEYKNLTKQIHDKQDEIYDLVEEWKKKNPSPKGDEAFDKWWDELEAYESKLYRERVEPLKKQKGAIVEEERQVVKNVLKKIRPLGYDEQQLKVHLNITGRKRVTDVRKAVLDAYQHYPTEWIENSIKHSNLDVIKVERGYYSHHERVVAISGGYESQMLETGIHELGHRFERTQNLREYERIFYNRRTEGEELVWMGSGYKKTELTRKDNFLHPYIGKDYGGSAYEVVSMGFQWAFTNPERLLKDEDFAQFIFGLLSVR